MYYHGEPPKLLGKSVNIRRVERSTVEQMIGSITLAFSSDGKRVVFIDNKVPLIICAADIREKCKCLVSVVVPDGDSWMQWSKVGDVLI